MPMKKNLQMENISNIKTLCSSWSEDIIHDNEKYTLKHKTLLFYNNKGKALYLVLDKNMELLDIFKKNCHNLKEYVEINKK